MTQIIELADENFKVAIITKFNDVKENMLIMNKNIYHSRKIESIKSRNSRTEKYIK